MSRREVLIATGMLVLGFLLGLGSASMLGPSFDPDKERTASEMEQAVGSAMNETSAFSRSWKLSRLFAGLDAENVEGAARGMRTRSEFLDPVDLQLFLSAWTRFDGLSAMGEAESWPSEVGREIGMRIVMREWAASGQVLEAGLYYQSLESNEMKAIVAGPLIRGWALSGDIEGALKRVRMFWDHGDPVNTVDGFVRGALNSVGAGDLIERIMALEPSRGGAFEHRLMRVTLSLGARENLDAASAAYVRLEGDSPPDWLHGALKTIAGPWAETDPRGAIEWLLERADRPERTILLKETMRSWSIEDLDGAWEWWGEETEQSEAFETRGRTISRLLPTILRRMARVRPVEACKWVEQIEKPAAREHLILRIAYFWAFRSPIDAQAWIDALELPESLSAKAREAIARGVAARQDGDEGAEDVRQMDEDSTPLE